MILNHVAANLHQLILRRGTVWRMVALTRSGLSGRCPKPKFWRSGIELAETSKNFFGGAAKKFPAAFNLQLHNPIHSHGTLTTSSMAQCARCRGAGAPKSEFLPVSAQRSDLAAASRRRCRQKKNTTNARRVAAASDQTTTKHRNSTTNQSTPTYRQSTSTRRRSPTLAPSSTPATSPARTPPSPSSASSPSLPSTFTKTSSSTPPSPSSGSTPRWPTPFAASSSPRSRRWRLKTSSSTTTRR